MWPPVVLEPEALALVLDPLPSPADEGDAEALGLLPQGRARLAQPRDHVAELQLLLSLRVVVFGPPSGCGGANPVCPVPILAWTW